MAVKRRIVWAGLSLLAIAGVASGAAISNKDSNQPRGAATGQRNAAGQSLDPLVDGMRNPAHRGDHGLSPFAEWAGNMMANATRDAAFFAELASANEDQIKYLNALYADATTRPRALALLATLGLQFGPGKDIDFDPVTNRLQPEEKLPVIADLCLRCHTPAGWLEAKSEPATSASPFLAGQFWGAALTEYPGHTAPITVTGTHPTESYDEFAGPYLSGAPRLPFSNGLRGIREAEGEMDGVSCDVCHRAVDNFKRTSRGPNRPQIAAGNGGLFLLTQDPSKSNNGIGFTSDFIKTGHFCGTCHDVTNPVLKTRTPVNGQVPDILHPIERTYTEWYWSDFRKKGIDCQECHTPMEFFGAQTWMLYPGMTDLWGAVDDVWTKPPYNYGIPPDRADFYRAAAERNERFMRKAATLQLKNVTVNRATGQVSVTVRITNNTGHKLPTGFAEGRQMWLHVTAEANGTTLDQDGELVDGEPQAQKIYQQIALAEGYEDVKLDGYSILDDDKDGTVSQAEKKNHFVLMNDIVLDNRIPPRGFDRAGYQADGAFIVPATLYPQAGQNWDETTYDFTVPTNISAPITFRATLRYRTFNREYVDFLSRHGNEPTVKHGGRARNIPDRAGTQYGALTNWGDVIYSIWERADRGRPVDMATASQTVN